MNAHPNLKIELHGHNCCIPDQTDAFDPDTGQYDLSIRRAEQVYKYLKGNGINKKRLSYKGFGSKFKIFQNDIHQLEYSNINRRVDVKIIAE